MKKNFKGQLDDETVHFFFRRHWSKILSNFFLIFLILICFVSTFFLGFIGLSGQDLHNFKWVILIVLTTLTWFLHFQFSKVFYYHLHTVVVTNMRLVIVDKSVFFRDSRDSIDLLKIQDINKKQNGLLPTLLNYGAFEITLSGSDKPVIIDLVPTPDHYFKRLNTIKQDMSQKVLAVEDRV